MMVQKLFNEYKELRNKADELEARMMEDFENEELEEAWDAAYNEEFAKHEELVKVVANLTNVNEKAARKMIASEKFEALMNCIIVD